MSAVRGKEPGAEGSIKDFMASKRRIIRERVLQALYAHELSHNPVAAIIETVLEDLKKDPATFDFARSLVQRVIDAEDELDTLIKKKVAKLRELSPLWEMYKEGVDLATVQWAAH